MAAVENRGDWAGLGLWPRMTDATGMGSPSLDETTQIAIPDGAILLHIVNPTDISQTVIFDDEGDITVEVYPGQHLVFSCSSPVLVRGNSAHFWFDMLSAPEPAAEA